MGVEIYNFDKVVRKQNAIKIGGIDYFINEPTVGDYAKISKLDFSKENYVALEELAKILAPTIKLEWLTKETMNHFFALCFKTLEGDFGDVEEKKLKLEELKQE